MHVKPQTAELIATTVRHCGFRKSIVGYAVAPLLCLVLVLPAFATFTLDPTFNGGRLTIAFPDSSSGFSSRGLRIFVQPSGRIVAGGTFSWATPDGQIPGVAMVGLSQAGMLDTTYGSGGSVLDWQSNAFMSFQDAVMYPDGRTLRISQVFTVTGSSTVKVVRLNADGSSDDVFNSNAAVGANTGFGTARPSQVALRSDGKILILIRDQGEFFLYRLNSNGTRDTTFGVNGVVPVNFNKITLPSTSGGDFDMIALPDGKVLISGHVSAIDASSEFFLARLTESGNWDKTFGRTGFMRRAFGSGMTGRIQDAILQPDGKLLLSGSVTDGDSDVWMMRLKSNGRVDTSFGTDGVVVRDFTPAGTDTATAATLSADGKIRLVGYFGSPANFLVARFAANGAFEESTGISFTAAQYALGYDVTIQSDGKLLVIGETKNPSPATTGSMFAVARLTE